VNTVHSLDSETQAQFWAFKSPSQRGVPAGAYWVAPGGSYNVSNPSRFPQSEHIFVLLSSLDRAVNGSIINVKHFGQ